MSTALAESGHHRIVFDFLPLAEGDDTDAFVKVAVQRFERDLRETIAAHR